MSRYDIKHQHPLAGIGEKKDGSTQALKADQEQDPVREVSETAGTNEEREAEAGSEVAGYRIEDPRERASIAQKLLEQCLTPLAEGKWSKDRAVEARMLLQSINAITAPAPHVTGVQDVASMIEEMVEEEIKPK